STGLSELASDTLSETLPRPIMAFGSCVIVLSGVSVCAIAAIATAAQNIDVMIRFGIDFELH
ncbi:hypothetical protein, partial [uncultured Muribaculum sp.]|uniref:hypothetical protein n=1 Tax=uncultured Muribaculum sp. TaxID=1918613 RepID=UPI00272A783C